MKIIEIINKLKNFLFKTILGKIIFHIITLFILGTLLFWYGTSSNCSVQGINLRGSLSTYLPEYNESDPSVDYYDVVTSEDIVSLIKEANENPNIKAIVIEVDSGGGSPVAGEEISNAIVKSKKPIVAFIRETGASSSYWAISGADRIFASKNSDVGSIGITMSYLSNVGKNQKDGFSYEQLSLGKYKDAGSPDKVLTKEEKELLMRDVNIVYKNFIEAVAKNRKLPIDKVQEIADGSSVLGEQAKALGLIDEIGGIDEVEKYLGKIIGEEAEICWE